MLSFSLKQAAAEARRTPEHKIDCGAGSFLIRCRRPSYTDRLQDEALHFLYYAGGDVHAYARQIDARMRACVVGWSGVMDGDSEDPAEVAYSHEALLTLCGAFPEAAAAISQVLRPLFEDIGPALGESAPPPNGSGPADSSAPAPTP